MDQSVGAGPLPGDWSCSRNFVTPWRSEVRSMLVKSAVASTAFFSMPKTAGSWAKSLTAYAGIVTVVETIPSDRARDRWDNR